MTLKELFPMLLQYAPMMLDAVQNRGYDPLVMLKNVNKYFGGEDANSISNLYGHLYETDSLDDIGRYINSADEVFNQYLEDSDNPKNEFPFIKNDGSKLLSHVPEYSLDEITSDYVPALEYFIKNSDDNTGYERSDKLNALGYARQMFNKRRI